MDCLTPRGQRPTESSLSAFLSEKRFLFDSPHRLTLCSAYEQRGSERVSRGFVSLFRDVWVACSWVGGSAGVGAAGA